MSDALHQSRYIVGIDLGTTNSACFFYDTYQENHAGEVFNIPQVVASGEVSPCRLLPSFCYLPGVELPDGAVDLPWLKNPPQAVGTFARDYGATLPSQLINSAKSWLSHAGVDREDAILPWGSNSSDKLSPLAVS
ncbi:MAG TPA: molecular chaperone DnaK, partial [Lentisphaeria bacterium]|nr:molecular chaperone DnaK [Lentisphaeria bacterium]